MVTGPRVPPLLRILMVVDGELDSSKVIFDAGKKNVPKALSEGLMVMLHLLPVLDID